MDQAEPSPFPGLPGRSRRRAPEEEPRRGAGGELDHPVVAGYDGSPSSRHALAYAAGMSRRLGRPLLIVFVTSPGLYCEPLTGQVIGAVRDRSETERWLLSELDEVCDQCDIEARVVTRRGTPARELAAVADETGADALVIGAPGHRWHHVAGSVPGWLARHAHCPVIVVP
jgi:nucleotide-binding universal stress UspA family protein